jgi:hypothetical protein
MIRSLLCLYVHLKRPERVGVSPKCHHNPFNPNIRLHRVRLLRISLDLRFTKHLGSSEIEQEPMLCEDQALKFLVQGVDVESDPFDIDDRLSLIPVWQNTQLGSENQCQ